MSLFRKSVRSVRPRRVLFEPETASAYRFIVFMLFYVLVLTLLVAWQTRDAPQTPVSAPSLSIQPPAFVRT